MSRRSLSSPWRVPGDIMGAMSDTTTPAPVPFQRSGTSRGCGARSSHWHLFNAKDQFPPVERWHAGTLRPGPRDRPPRAEALPRGHSRGWEHPFDQVVTRSWGLLQRREPLQRNPFIAHPSFPGELFGADHRHPGANAPASPQATFWITDQGPPSRGSALAQRVNTNCCPLLSSVRTSPRPAPPTSARSSAVANALGSYRR